jgi:hypothetical protein
MVIICETPKGGGEGIQKLKLFQFEIACKKFGALRILVLHF